MESMQGPVRAAVRDGVEAVRRFGRSRDGQDLLEYGLLAALIAVIAIGAVATVGATVGRVLWTSIASSF